jgi:hypothetical protein
MPVRFITKEAFDQLLTNAGEGVDLRLDWQVDEFKQMLSDNCILLGQPQPLNPEEMTGLRNKLHTHLVKTQKDRDRLRQMD